MTKPTATQLTPTTLKHLFEATLRTVWRGTKGEDTATANAQFAVDFFGAGTPFNSITTADIDQWVEALINAGNSPATINRKLAALGRMLSFAVERGWMDKVPHIPRRKEAEGRIRWLTKVEEARLLPVLIGIDEHFHDLCVFLIDTGARPAEALSAKWVDYGNGLVTFWDTKSGKPRSIPLTERVKVIIAKWTNNLSALADVEGPFTQFNQDRLTYLWNKARETMNLIDDPQFVPYMLRHTCASRLVQAGVPILTVKDWLGHKKIEMTLRYAHLSPRNLLEAVKFLEV